MNIVKLPKILWNRNDGQDFGHDQYEWGKHKEILNTHNVTESSISNTDKIVTVYYVAKIINSLEVNFVLKNVINIIFILNSINPFFKKIIYLTVCDIVLFLSYFLEGIVIGCYNKDIKHYQL